MANLTTPEKQALSKHPPISQRLKSQIAIKSLATWSEADLRQLARALKGVNKFQGQLYNAKQKVKAALPAETWPKVLRQLPLRKEEFAFEGDNGQVLRLNGRALPHDLNKRHVWGDAGTAQMDLFIIGPLDAIYAALNQAPAFCLENAMSSNNPSSENLQVTQGYGAKLFPSDPETEASFRHASAAMPLWVTCEPLSRLTDERGEVLLDARRELFETGVGAVAGFAGGFSAAGPEIIDILKTALDTIGLVELANKEPGELFEMARSRIQGSGRIGQRQVTITVGLHPGGETKNDRTGFRSSVNTGMAKLDPAQSVAAIHAAIATSLASGSGW